MEIQELTTKLKKLNACDDAIKWLQTQKSVEQAWQNCERGDWLLWLCGQLDRKRLVLSACDCTELSIHLVPEDEKRPAMAIEIARQWTRGEATLKEVKSAAADAYAAYDAYDAADAAADAACAAYAAATAAYVASDAAYAAACAAYATYAAAYVAAADAAYDAAYVAYAAYADKENTLAKCAVIARSYFSSNEVLEALNGNSGIDN